MRNQDPAGRPWVGGKRKGLGFGGCELWAVVARVLGVMGKPRRGQGGPRLRREAGGMGEEARNKISRASRGLEGVRID